MVLLDSWRFLLWRLVFLLAYPAHHLPIWLQDAKLAPAAAQVQPYGRVCEIVGGAQQDLLADAVEQGVVQPTAEPVASVPGRDAQGHELEVPSHPLLGDAGQFAGDKISPVLPAF